MIGWLIFLGVMSVAIWATSVTVRDERKLREQLRRDHEQRIARELSNHKRHERREQLRRIIDARPPTRG